MTLITRIPGVTFTDATLPKLYRDATVTLGTRFLYDSLDTYSYAKQASPIAGVDVWTDLSPLAANASFSGGNVFGSGGFSFSPVGSQNIALPASGKSASNAAGFVFGLWIKYLASSATAYSGIAGMCDNTSALTNQWSIDNGNTSSGQIRLTILGNTGGIFTPAINSINQIVVACKKLVNGTYDFYYYRNGLLLSAGNVGNTSISPSIAAASPSIGTVGGFGAGANFRAFRAFQDDTSALVDQAAITSLVLKDYNANVGRFS